MVSASSEAPSLDLDRLRDALGAGDDRGHLGLDLIETLVALALGADRAPVDLQLSRACDLRCADQFRNLGSDLPRLRIERVFAEHDEIEVSARQPKRERTRRRERVRSGERAIFQVDRVVHSHRERVDQRTARLRRSHRDDSSLRAVTVFQRDGERDSAQVERTDHVGPVALDGFGGSVEVGFLDQRDLLDANGNLQHSDTPRPDEAS